MHHRRDFHKRRRLDHATASSSSPVDDEHSPSPTPSNGALISIIENRAKEIGVAVYDRERHVLRLGQFIETSLTYTATLALLHRHAPERLLLVDECTKSRAGGLNRAIRDYFDNAHPLPRSAFDDSEGALLVDRVAIKTDAGIDGRANESQRYLSFGAAGALLSYLQDVEFRVIASGTLVIQWIGTDKHMQLDLASMECLGLVHSVSPKDKACPPSLYSVMDRTKTKCGSRLLRSNLLQPLTHVPTLQCRYDAVRELVTKAEFRLECEQALKCIPTDLDRICSIFALYVPNSCRDGQLEKDVAVSRRIARLVDGVMLTKDVLESLHGLRDALQSSESVILRAIHDTISCDVFDELLHSVRSVLDDHVHRQKSAALKRIEQCYAVKSGYDGFLDVARTNFCKITEQIHSLANRLQDEHHLENIKVVTTLTISHHAYPGVLPFQQRLLFSRDPREQLHLISVFSSTVCLLVWIFVRARWLCSGWMIIEQKGKHIHCVTHELIALNARLKDATHDCMLLTQQALENVVEDIIDRLNPIRKMVDSIALLDILWSFAALAATSSEPYTQPTISEDGSLVISAGRHPCYEVMNGVEFCPNDTFLSPFSSCHIITGSNMSGKTTYLKQVALSVVMAQIGAFVPAEALIFSPLEKLFCRMGFSDSIETNASSFMVEMQEMAYILSNATDRSLVVVDELGRATSTADGESIAWAVGEKLIDIGSYTLIATHFKDLPRLTRLYPTARLQNFEAVLEEDALRFTWKLRSVQTEAWLHHLPEHYGIRLARILDFPSALLERAEAISNDVHLESLSLLSPEAVRLEGIGSIHASFLYGLAQKLLCLSASREELDDERLRAELQELKGSLEKALI